jgi:hypothetical protein
LLFVALARAVGLHAAPLMVSSRKLSLFMKGYPNERQLNSMVVSVRLGQGFVYLDPATRFCPYGLLPWDEADTSGVLEDSEYPNLGSTPASKSKEAIVRREADLKLSSDGGLSGKVVLLYFGQEALNMRLEAIREDEAERRKELEESLKSMLMQGAALKLVKAEGGEDSGVPLRAEFEVDIPNFAVPAGKRMILPLGVLHAHEKNPLATPRRTHPVYFGYPHESYEEVSLELPAGIEVESLPANAKADQGAVYYELSSKKEGNTIQIGRTFRISGSLYTLDQYSKLSAFYDRVLEGDGRQAAVRVAEPSNPN